MPGRLTSCSRYALYYGAGRPNFPQYDLVVLEPSGWSVDQLRRLRSTHAIRLAYVAVLEVPVGSGAPPPYVLRHEGQGLQNPLWRNWILDPRHPHTLRRLLDQATALRNAGWDGVFLDTMADAESPDLPSGLRGVLVPSTARLVAELASSWPGAILIQNWGFGPLLPLTAPFLDGVCWEDFPWGRLAHDGPVIALARRLQTWARAAKLQVLALNQYVSDPDQAAAVAGSWGFLWYGVTGSYSSPPPGPS